MIQLERHAFKERDLLHRVMMNLPSTPARRRKQYRWAVVMQLFGLGSTCAWHLCKEFELDPDELI